MKVNLANSRREIEEGAAHKSDHIRLRRQGLFKNSYVDICLFIVCCGMVNILPFRIFRVPGGPFVHSCRSRAPQTLLLCPFHSEMSRDAVALFWTWSCATSRASPPRGAVFASERREFRRQWFPLPFSEHYLVGKSLILYGSKIAEYGILCSHFLNWPITIQIRVSHYKSWLANSDFGSQGFRTTWSNEWNHFGW